MSVLISGMKMPKCCDVCQFSDWSNLHQTALCDLYDYKPCFKDFSREYTSKRSNNCPLVELPEKHGRLVEFIDVATETDEDTGTEEIKLGAVFCAYFKMRESKPVIEAEGE